MRLPGIHEWCPWVTPHADRASFCPAKRKYKQHVVSIYKSNIDTTAHRIKKQYSTRCLKAQHISQQSLNSPPPCTTSDIPLAAAHSPKQKAPTMSAPPSHPTTRRCRFSFPFRLSHTCIPSFLSSLYSIPYPRSCALFLSSLTPQLAHLSPSLTPR